LAAQFSTIAEPEGGDGFIAPVSYVDYSEGVDDLIALCMTGFPDFDGKATQRRSVVYVGPGEVGGRAALFDTSRVERMAATAGIQINALAIGSDDVCSLASATGGQCFDGASDESGVTAELKQIRSHPPAPSDVDGDGDREAVKLQESPDIPILVALLAVLALVVAPVVRRP
jgi:hypothetical protein